MLVQRDAGTLTADEYNRQIERLKKNDYLKEWSDAVLRNQVLQQYNMAFRAKGNRLTSSINLNFKRSNQGIVNEHNNILNFSYRGDIYAAKWLDVAVGFNANMVRSKNISMLWGICFLLQGRNLIIRFTVKTVTVLITTLPLP